ncbi:MAG: sensor histidine kinase [Alphaproteobacteria bacterium]
MTDQKTLEQSSTDTTASISNRKISAAEIDSEGFVATETMEDERRALENDLMNLSIDDDIYEELKHDRTILVYRLLPAVLLATLIVSIVTSCVFAENIMFNLSGRWWLAGVFGVTLLRFISLCYWHKASAQRKKRSYWRVLLIVGSLCNGFLWGSTAFWLLPLLPETQRLYPALISCAVLAAASAALIGYLPLFFAFLFLSVVPHITVLGFFQDFYQPIPSLILTMFAVVAMGVAWWINIVTRDKIYSFHHLAMQARRLKALAEDLALSREEAEAASKAKSNFLANMSHELRTPLNAIIGFSDLMQSGVFGPLGSPKYFSYVQDIRASGMHLLDLIDQILNLSKIESGHEELRETVFSASSLSDTALNLIKPQAAKAKVTVRMDELAPNIQIKGDILKFRQMLLNLLSNAVKFTPGGEVQLIMEFTDDGWLEIAVKDTGIGMTEMEIEVALTPFRQVDNVHTRRHTGTGLGLPLTKRLIELHGGKMLVASNPGKGTKISLMIPPSRLQTALQPAPHPIQQAVSL